jgi:hypothetical protein
MTPLVPANVAIEQRAVSLHAPVDSLVIGRFCSQRLPLENGVDPPIAVGRQLGDDRLDLEDQFLIR